jgi:phosphatidylglycerol:prolipoprotein diacylglycerol transferase
MVCFDGTGQLRLVETFFRVVNIAQGGLVVFGSILGGMFGAFLFIRRNRMPMLKTFDAMAPALMLGIAVGRIGCLLNGCCFGGATDVPWGIVFPEGSPVHIHQFAHSDIFCCGLKFKDEKIDGQNKLAISEVQKGSEAERIGLKPDMLLRSVTGKRQEQNEQMFDFGVQTREDAAGCLAHFLMMLPHEKIRLNVFINSSLTTTEPYWITPSCQSVLPVHPTQIYSSCTAVLLCGVLLWLSKLDYYRQRSGLVFATFMVVYPVARFILEVIRTDEDSFLGTGLTVSQNVSIAVCLAGITLFLYLTRKK